MNDELLRDLTHRAPLPDPAALPRVVTVVARALLPWASPASRAALAAVVGDGPLRGGERDTPIDLERLYDAVCGASGLRQSAALELAQSTLVAIAHAIGPDARARLYTELPVAWASLLDDAHDVPVDRRPAPPITAGHTLASGRPGSASSVVEAAPQAAQRDSIAGSDDPHGDTKLSGAAGTRTRRRTLADGGG